MITQSFLMAIKSIASNKMRSFLTLLGVIIGVVAIVVLVAIAQGTNAQVTSNIEGMGTNLITANIRTQRSNPLDMQDLEELAQNQNIAGIAPVVTQTGTAKAGVTTYTDGSILGTTTEYLDIRNMELASGRFLKQPDLDNRSFVAILGSEAAQELFGTVNVVGETFTLDGYTFTVVGTLQENGSSSNGSNDNQIIIPFPLAQRLYAQSGITSFYAASTSADTVTAAQYAITDYLNGLFASSLDSDGSNSAYTLYSQSDMLDTLSETTATLTLMLGGIAAISLLVGGIGIMNIMLVSVSERTREIGIRKAIGAARSNILTQFLVEALVISLLGGLLGVGVAWMGTLALTPVLDMQLSVDPSIALLAIGFSLLIGIGFGLYPANKASKLRPIQALHYEG